MQVKPGPSGSVEMVAARDIRQDEDLLLSYGALDNTFLLLDYGAPPCLNAGQQRFMLCPREE